MNKALTRMDNAAWCNADCCQLLSPVRTFEKVKRQKILSTTLCYESYELSVCSHEKDGTVMKGLLITIRKQLKVGREVRFYGNAWSPLYM